MSKSQKLRPATKVLHCAECGKRRDNVGGDTVKIICWECVNKMMTGGKS